MKYGEAKEGRIFILRLEDGETVHEEIETFAAQQGIRAAALVVLGGADSGSTLVVGPEDGRASPVNPLQHILGDVHEVTGTGTLFPDDTGQPRVHMHLSCGRRADAVTGCIRRGVKVWHVMEIVLFELVGTTGRRVHDPRIGFALLNPDLPEEAGSLD